jgi:hypothetical protein
LKRRCSGSVVQRSNTVHRDARGLPISAASAKGATAYDHLVAGYLTYRADTPGRLTALLDADPDFALAHCMQGYFAMLGFKQAVVPSAVQAVRTAEARIGDCASAFTLPHWLMALTATGRIASAERMVEAMRAFADGHGTVPRIVRDYALPIAEAQLAHAAGRHAEAVAKMRPALGGMYRMGGSHTQQDVLEQLFVDAALKAGSLADVRLAVERVAGRRAIPPERYIGWREAVRLATPAAS